MKSRQNSIQRNLLLYLTAAILALFIVGSVATWFLMRKALYDQLDHNLIRTAEDFLAETERMPNGEIDSGFHDLDLEHFRDDGPELASFYQLRDAKGDILLQSQSLDPNKELPFRPNSDFVIDNISIPSGGKGRAVFVSFPTDFEEHDLEDPGDLAEIAARTEAEKNFIATYDSDDPENFVNLTMVENTKDLSQSLTFLAITLAVTGSLLAGTTLVLVRRIVKSVCRPIIDVAEMVERIGPGELDTPLPAENVPTEIQPLIVKFNGLIERLDLAINRERRFSIDIAHELRTPVTEMRILMEVSAALDPDDDGSTKTFQLGAIISQRMSRLIEVLTAIHQGESQTLEIEAESVDLIGLVRDSAAAIEAGSRNRVEIFTPDDPQLLFKTDPALFRAIVDNLLSNSLTHSPPDSTVYIRVLDKCIEIENSVQSLSESDLEKFDEAFWQKDLSRTDSDHFGLGLTLVSTYAHLLGTSVNRRIENEILVTSVQFSK